jgi:hypothetical protein
MAGLPFVDEDRGVSRAFGYTDPAPLAEVVVDDRAVLPGDRPVGAEHVTGAAGVAVSALQATFDLLKRLLIADGQ